jgi:hypothetical protein
VHPAPDLPALDEACARQHGEVLHDGRQRHRKSTGDLGDARLVSRQALQNGAPRRVGEGSEGEVELPVMVNHSVK